MSIFDNNFGLNETTYLTLRTLRLEQQSRPFRAIYDPMYQKHVHRVERFFMTRGITEDKAIDLTQEAFIKFTRVLLFKEPPIQLGNLFSYVITIGLRLMGRQATENDHLVALEEMPNLDIQAENTTDALVLADNVLEIFDIALTSIQLTPRDATVLRLIYLDQMTHEEVTTIIQKDIQPDFTTANSRDIKRRKGHELLMQFKNLLAR